MHIKEFHDRMSEMHIKIIKSNNIEMIKSFGLFIDNLLYLTSQQCYMDIYREEMNKQIAKM